MKRKKKTKIVSRRSDAQGFNTRFTGLSSMNLNKYIPLAVQGK